MNVQLQEITLTNYRSCQKTRIDLHPKLSVLIGPNGSGKSNILKGLLLLSKLSSARSYRGPVGRDTSRCTIHAKFLVNGKQAVLFKSRIAYSTDDRNRDDIRSAVQLWKFDQNSTNWMNIPLSFADRLTGDIYNTDFHGFGPARVTVDASIYAQLLGLGAKEGRTLTSHLPVVTAIKDALAKTSYYGASQFSDPSECPIFFELEGGRTYPRLRPRGKDHTRFLFDLYFAKQENTTGFQRFIEIVGTSGLNLIRNVSFKTLNGPSGTYDVRIGGKLTKRKAEKTLIIPSFQIRGSRLSPNQLSEGTFKTLALLFYILTDQNARLLIEEPEVCVHHGLLTSILEIINSVSQRKQIIISTHSDHVLDMVKPENVFIVQNPDDRGTCVQHATRAFSAKRLDQLREYLSSEGNLGEYWRHGGLEK